MRNLDWWTGKTFVMTDLETTSVNAYNAGITSLGMHAFRFDIDEDTGGLVKQDVYDLYAATEPEFLDMHLDSARGVLHTGTLRWRNSQPEGGLSATEKKHLIEDKAIGFDTVTALLSLVDDYFKEIKEQSIGDVHVISNHTEFDISILQRYYYSSYSFHPDADVVLPWGFRAVHNMQDLIIGLGYDKSEIRKELGITTSHSALDDCHTQTDILECALRHAIADSR